MHDDYYTSLFIGARKMSLLLFMLAHKSTSTFNATNLSSSLGHFVFENISMLTTDVTLSQDSLEHTVHSSVFHGILTLYQPPLFERHRITCCLAVLC